MRGKQGGVRDAAQSPRETMPDRKPPNWIRLLTAYGTAAVVAGLLAGYVTMNPLVMVVVMGVVLAFELVVLLPVYVALHYRGQVTRRNVLAVGFVVGAAPWAWFGWPLAYPEMRTTSSVGGVQTMVDGVPTLAGWLQYGAVVAFFGFCGLVAASGFWVALGKRGPRPERHASPEAGTPTIAGPWHWWQPVVVVLAIGVMVMLPVATKDRSCHNLFRDRPLYGSGPNSARSKVNLSFPALTQEWNDVARLLVAFGKERNLEILDMTEQDQHSKQLYVSLCNESGTAISILDRVYFFGPPMEARSEQSVNVYGMRPDSDWKQQAAALEGFLRARYGEKLRREDPPIASVSELSERLKSVHERPKFSIDELVDRDQLVLPCRGKRVEVRHIGAIPDTDEHEFEVACANGQHRFIAGTKVHTHEKITFTTRKAPELPKVP